MLAVGFPERNFTFVKPAGMSDEECASLDVWKGTDEGGMPVIISYWKPNLEDLQALSSGQGIYLMICGAGMPPVSLFTENPFVHQHQQG